MRFLKTVFQLGLVLCFATCFTTLTFAQSSNSGDIRGTVTDSSGALLPDTKVSVKNVDTGVTNEFTTNSDGLYDTVSTVPGHYLITFTKAGFQQVVRGPLTLGATIITIDGHLDVGNVSQQVIVTGEAPLLQTENGEQSTTLEPEALVELPQVGQDWQNFVITLPGTSGYSTLPSGVANPGIGAAVNGNLRYYNNYATDGVAITMPHSGNAATAVLETLTEVKIDTSTFSAQYGIGGAVFNQITKSGTNTWHGALYEYFQNDALNARSYFSAPNKAIPFLRYNNFGGAVSGPVLKNKLFVYFNLDQRSKHSQNFGFETLPTLAERTGDFSAILGGPALDAKGSQQINPCTGQPILQNQIFDQSTLTTVNGKPCRQPFPGNKITNLDPVANALQAYYPTPTYNTLSNNYYYLAAEINSAQKLFGRMDYDLNEKHHITGTAVEQNTNNPSIGEYPCPVGCQLENITFDSTRISDVWTISHRVVNQANFGFTREGNWYIPETLGLGIPAKIGLQYAKADLLPQTSVSGGIGTCCDGLSPNINAIFVQNVFQPSDIATLIVGKHILNFGGEVEINQANVTPWGNVQAGQFTFTGIYTQATPSSVGSGFGYADFLLGEVQAWSANNSPLDGGRQKNPQVFIQDDIKLTGTLTVNLGLRYQIESGWKEVHNRIGTFDPNLNNTVSNSLGAMWFPGTGSRNSLQANVYDIFLPRVGFAWSALNHAVVRGGFGIYSYEWSLDNYGSDLGIGASNYGSAADRTSGVTPLVSLSGSGSTLPYLLASSPAATSSTAYNGQSVHYTKYHTPDAKIAQWTFGIEDQLAGGVVGKVVYVGSHAMNVSFPTDINQVPESKLGPNDNPPGRPFPQFGSISGDTYNSITNYDSLQATAAKQFVSGWSFNVNYTFAKFLSDQDSAGWGGEAGPQTFQNGYVPSLNYAPSNMDIKHALKASGVYALPFGRGKRFLNANSIVDSVIGGWRLSGIYVAQTGNPFTISYGGTNLSYAQAGV